MKKTREEKFTLLKTHFQQVSSTKTKLLEISAALTKNQQIVSDNEALIDTVTPLKQAYQQALAHLSLGGAEVQDIKTLADEITAAETSDTEKNLYQVTLTKIALETIIGLEGIRVSLTDLLLTMTAPGNELRLDILRDLAAEHAAEYEKNALLAINSLMELMACDSVIARYKENRDAASGLLPWGLLPITLPAITRGEVLYGHNSHDQTKLIHTSRHQMSVNEKHLDRVAELGGLFTDSELGA